MKKAILHIDGDSFFAACEQARNPLLKGHPVVTGREKGIASSMSIEAKQAGITRGMRLFEMRNLCPDVTIMESDYEMYTEISRRFLAIVRRYAPVVEEYGIDECFADLTGIDKAMGMSYTEIARNIQQDIKRELDCGFSIGIAPTKVLAKLGSRLNKPMGIVVITPETSEKYLEKIEVGKIWGIGPQTSANLNTYGIFTALEFTLVQKGWIESHFNKTIVDIWKELRGSSVLRFDSGAKKARQSIQTTRTFNPCSDSKSFVFSQLSRNIENACIRARRHRQAAREVTFFLRTQDFRHVAVRAKLSRATAFPNKIIDVAEKLFKELFDGRMLYRATGVVFSDLTGDMDAQLDLFGAHLSIENLKRLYSGVDALSGKFGKHTVFTGSSFAAQAFSHTNEAFSETVKVSSSDMPRRQLGIPLFSLGNVPGSVI